MDLEEIKNLIELDGGKFIFLEKGRPILTAMSFDDYKKILGKFNLANLKTPEQENPGRNPGDEQLPKELEEEPLKIEDLPV